MTAPEHAGEAVTPGQAASRVSVEATELNEDETGWTEAGIFIDRGDGTELAEQMLLATPAELDAIYAGLKLHFEQGIWSFRTVAQAAIAVRAVTPGQAATELIAAERLRQIAQEGYTSEHDREHGSGDLAVAGAFYAVCAARPELADAVRSMLWPWGWRFSGGDAVRMLTKAGALIAAEIDRLQGTAQAAIAAQQPHVCEPTAVQPSDDVRAAPELPKLLAHPDDLAEEWLADEFEPDDSPTGVSWDREQMINAFRAGFDQARGALAVPQPAPEMAAAMGQLADEMYAEVQMIAPHGSGPDEIPDIADYARSDALTQCADKIREILAGVPS